jgi:galactonate dehydratase
MRITAVKPILTDRYLLVRVATDAGLTGNGEAGLWARHEVVAREIESLAEYFVGQDPALIEHHHQAVSRATHFMGSVSGAALSAIDVALWDIAGKAAGMPVHRLLGGRCRDRIKVFENVAGDSVEARADHARELVEGGFTALRTSPFFAGWERTETSSAVIGDAVEIVGAIRDAIGDRADLGVEIHRNLTPDEAINLAHELAPFRLSYYEDPLPPESEDALEYVARHVDLPIAVGERSYNLFQFAELIGRRIAAFIRPDLSLAGGITQVKKIAALAEANFVRVFPHLMGSPVNTCAFAQLDAAIPNYFVQEANIKQGPALELVDEQPRVVDGYLQLPERPGIGIEIDEEAAARLPFQSRTVSAALHADGSVPH